MFAAITRLLPSATTFLHQIAPSVIATLIAAGLISGYNRAFSGHLQQPRMAALHEAGAESAAAPAPAITTVAMTKPPAAPVTEYITIVEPTGEPARVAEKEPKAEAGKDQTLVKVAAPAPVPAARPVAAAAPVPRPEPRVASVPVVVAPAVAVAPVTVAPIAPPPVMAVPAALPPPVIMAPAAASAPPPMVTVPDRPRPAAPTYEAQVDEAVVPPPRPQGPFGMIVNTLRPSSLFARAREFGERIEAAGNEILPNIRPQ